MQFKLKDYGQRKQIEDGAIVVTGRDANGAVIAEHAAGKRQQAKSVWNLDSHGATAYGTQMVSALLPGRRFPYPKSLYAVEDTIREFISRLLRRSSSSPGRQNRAALTVDRGQSAGVWGFEVCRAALPFERVGDARPGVAPAPFFDACQSLTSRR